MTSLRPALLAAWFFDLFIQYRAWSCDVFEGADGAFYNESNDCSKIIPLKRLCSIVKTVEKLVIAFRVRAYKNIGDDCNLGRMHFK